MIKSIEEIFETNSIEINNAGERIPVHSHTSKEQGVFLQSVFDIVKPAKSLEVGFAYGISSLFILEKHCEIKSGEGAHLVIEPDNYWGNAAIHTIEKEGLSKYLQIRKDYSDRILPQLFFDNYRVQYVYIDTTKLFDVVLQDFYFINKILDVGGVVILDDCGGGCPGVQRVARFINSLPHYRVLAVHYKTKSTIKKRMANSIVSFAIKMVPLKKMFYPTIEFRTDEELGLNYNCIAFQKIDEDTRSWDWDKAI